MKNLQIEQSIEILKQALNMSAKAGVFDLQSSSTVNTAFETVKQFYIDSLVVIEPKCVETCEKEEDNKSKK